jgi:hypothetical protein
MLGLLSLAVLAAACGNDAGGENDSTPGVIADIPAPSGDVTPRPRRTPIPSVTPSPTPLKVCAPNPDPAAFSALQLQEPSSEQRVKVPFHVRGWGSNIGFEGRGVALAIVNAKQEVTQVLDIPPQPREYRIAPGGLEVTEFTQPFAADVIINGVTEPTPYCLWVYLEATASGAPRGVIQVPIVVTP